MVKRISRLVLYFLLAVLLAAGGVMLWLMQEVRTFESLKPRLEAALNPVQAPYQIRLGAVAVDWRDPSRIGRISVENMVVTLLDGTAFAAVPKVEIMLDPLGFLPKRTALNSIILIAPKLYLTRTAEGIIRMGLEEGGQSLPLSQLVGFFSAGDSAGKSAMQLPFRSIMVERAGMTLKDEVSGAAVLQSTPLTVRLSKNSLGDVTGFLSMPFLYNGNAGRIDARLLGSLTSSDHSLYLSLSRVPVELACQFGVCPPDMQGTGFVSGKAGLVLSKHLQLVAGNTALRLRDGTFTAPTFFPEPLKVKDATVSAHLAEHGQHLVLDKVKLAMEDITLHLALEIIARGDDWRLILNGTGSPLDVTKLYKYWPKVLAPNSREALTGLLKSGRAENSRVHLDIDSAMYAVNKFPREAVYAVVDARNITTEYLPGFPLLKQASGQAKFIGNSLRVDASSGLVLENTHVISAILTADDLHAPRAPMVVRMRLNAPASDIATFLKLKHFSFDNEWKLNPATLGGSADIGMRLGFDSFSDNPESGLNLDAVTYDITANVSALSQPDLFGNLAVRSLDGTLHTSNNTLKFDGQLGLGASSLLNVDLAQDEKGKISADISGNIPRSEFAALGIPNDKRYVGEGTLGVKTHLLFGKDTVAPRQATLNLTDLELLIPELSWKKSRGVPGTLMINVAEGEGNYNASLNAADLTVVDARISLDANQNLRAIALPRVKTSRNNFALEYAAKGAGYAVKISGKRLDVADHYATSDNGILADFPAIDVTLDLAELILVPDNPLKSVRGTLLCTTERCNSMQMTASTGKGILNAVIKPAIAGQIKSRREFLLSANDAGELLRSLGITDRVYDGRLELSGRYEDTLSPPLLNGRLLMTDFSLKNSEILGRIVSLASITGVGDAITGSTKFEKLGAGITHQKGIVGISKGRATGNALGITLEGRIDTATTQMNIKGVLVPANLINSLFTKIPIIGKLAGKEGEGLIAFNYKVDGSYSDPDVSVNPFSGLTPGVLRGVFSGETAPGPQPSTPKKTVTH